MGTDLYWDKSFWEQQQEAFTIQINWAKKYNLPVVLHCRESLDETEKVLPYAGRDIWSFRRLADGGGGSGCVAPLEEP